MRTTTIRINDPLHARLVAEAQEQGISASEFIRQAVTAHIAWYVAMRHAGIAADTRVVELGLQLVQQGLDAGLEPDAIAATFERSLRAIARQKKP